MTSTLRTTLIVTSIIVVVAALLLLGIVIGRNLWGWGDPWHGGMMGRFGVIPSASQGFPYGYNMGPGMMGGYGMMGMMGGYGVQPRVDADPVSITDAQDAVQDYIGTLWNDDLVLGEVMVFDNHAYAQIIEESTGIGAIEVLVDPVTLGVYPEHGPNMMWNTKYGSMVGGMGMMGGYGMMGGGTQGGMMGELLFDEVSTEMPVSPEEAVEAAQLYLDAYLPGSDAGEHADPFYSYYTIHIEKDGTVTGMLSVNGYNRQVFVHTWHGALVVMEEKSQG